MGSNGASVVAFRTYYRSRHGGTWKTEKARQDDVGACRAKAVGNWKMEKAPREGVALALQVLQMCRGVRDVDIGFAPPFTGLDTLKPFVAADFVRQRFDMGGNVALFAQDVFYEEQGAFTGEISGKMLQDVGVDGVIIGHSDRRNRLGDFFGFGASVEKRLSPERLAFALQREQAKPEADAQVVAALRHFAQNDQADHLAGLGRFLAEDLSSRAGESDRVIHRKVDVTLKRGLLGILCFGENLEAREAGDTNRVIQQQLRGLAKLPKGLLKFLWLAYEPVWAIGTGQTASVEQIGQAHDYARDILLESFGEEVAASVPILYGGSVKPANMNEIMMTPGVDGALVGGASLKAEDFAGIVRFGLPE